ncbi:signal peptide peptidase SppA [Aestuariibacter sp. A3R04]|uniref:signal peptide peptidase SppA n=1 Tax=Aestuariibacter sp. A3R04 TaxID=2841571 RepID=UPI001C09463D|nr:signal peptide peptidase SppA [Aestuariibacter sp. A3R04]MBU3023067.1 signal peptide peptidase SppA [Aestuariibacter sp. A3R04]
MTASRSWTKSLFIGLWSVLNFSRKLLFNFIFLLIVIALIIAISNSDDPVNVKPGSALLLQLNGNLVIQKEQVDPFAQFMQEAFGDEPENPEVLVRDVEKVLSNAKQDSRIKALILDLSGLRGGGLDKLRRVAEALDDFKQEKPIYAIGDYYSQNQYYLAAHADHIYLNPMGNVMFEGYGHFGLYFKDMLDKLRITTHIFRVGTYKSAVEPYIRNDMSDAAKEANKLWLDEYWEQYKADVAAARGVDVDNFDETLDSLLTKFDEAGSDFAQYSLQNGWVDALKTREEVRQELVGLVGSSDDEMGVNVTTFNTYLKVLSPPLPKLKNDKDKIAIIVAKGEIFDGNQPQGTIGGESTARLLRKARKDKAVKAVVLEVDSPGGSSFASEIIRQEVLELQKAGKPVIVSMGTYAASGGYWFSAPADKIYASPSTVTGSIGVFGMFLTFEDTMDYIGIHTDGVASTDVAGLSPFRELDPRFGAILQRNVETAYTQFITMVAKHRNMTPEAVDKIAQGRVWLGSQALKLGLVDELGDINDAIAGAAEIAGLEDYDTYYVERTLSPQEQFWKEFFGQALIWGVKMQFVDSDSHLLKMVKNVLAEASQMTKLNDPNGVYTLCLQCEVI